MADACERRRDELARILTLDQGKPLKAEAEGEVGELIEFWRMAAEDGKRAAGHDPRERRARAARVLLLRRPLGVRRADHALELALHDARRGAGARARLRQLRGLDAGALDRGLLRACSPSAWPRPTFRRACSTWCSAPGPRWATSWRRTRAPAPWRSPARRATGLTVARRAAGKAQLLEMGGNGPFVVMDDADLEAAAEAARVGAFLGAGQSCSAAERLLVHEAVREEFVALLAGEVEREVRLGDPLDDATTMGPVNNEPGAAKMDLHVADARGARRDASSPAAAAPTASRPASTGSRRCSTTCRPTRSPSPRRPSGRSRRSSGIASLEEAIEQTNAQSLRADGGDLHAPTWRPACATPTRCTWAS